MRIALFFLLFFLGQYTNRAQEGFQFLANQTQVEIPFQLINNLIFVPITVNGIELNFLLDTGSSQSLINASMLLSLETKMIEDTMFIVGTDGNKISSNLCIMKVGYKDQEFEHNFAIKDLDEAFGVVKQESGVQIHGILGSDFLQKYKYVLDFKELIAYPK